MNDNTVTGSSEKDVIVIGCGFAGLSVAAALRNYRINNFIVFEKGGGIGAFWAGNYDRILLHSAYHDLPWDGGARSKYGMFLKRNELLNYFRDYASHHQLYPHLRLNEQVHRIWRSNSRWEMETEKGSYSAQQLAVATSANGRPHIPEIPGRDNFEGTCIHSRFYKNPEPFRGKQVLVVGSGNSAAEIALDLAEGGADSVHMWVRGPRHFIRLQTMARIIRILRFLRIDFTDRAFDREHQLTRVNPEFYKLLRRKDMMLRHLSVDLSDFGIRMPQNGPLTEMMVKNRVPVFDQGTIPLIQNGTIRIIDGNVRPISEFTPTGVRLGNDEEQYDTVILATGFKAVLDFIEDDKRLLEWDADKKMTLPITDGRCRSSVEPSLYFPGFDVSAIGGYSLGRWGWEIGQKIHSELNA